MLKRWLAQILRAARRAGRAPCRDHARRLGSRSRRTSRPPAGGCSRSGPSGAPARRCSQRSSATTQCSSSSSCWPNTRCATPDSRRSSRAATRMQRAAADLSGVAGARRDTRPWLRHAAWPADYLPLAPRAIDSRPTATPPADDYAFVRVSGDGVHEIPVGPVHAGIIEPGHFRFSIVGEKVLKLEERLGYAHKGIERLFAQHAARPTATGSRRACRATRRSRTRGRTVRRSKASRARACPSAPSGCARSRSRASASRIISAISAHSATTPASRSASRSSRASRSCGCARSTQRWASAICSTSSCPAAWHATRARSARRAGGLARRASRPKRRSCARSTTSTPACATGSWTRGR